MKITTHIPINYTNKLRNCCFATLRHGLYRGMGMKIVILGAGVIGITTAWYLSQEGHQVQVIERHGHAACDTSFANAGQISFGYSTPWAAPGIPQKALKWMFKEHSPLLMRPDASLYQLKWMMMMLQNCGEKVYEINKERMLRIADYSRERFAALRAETGIEYEGRQQGTLQVFRTEHQLEVVENDMKVLAECGIPFEKLTPEACAAAEPALGRVQQKLTGGLRLPEDETGDCYMFTNRLAQMCKDAGVEFFYDHRIDRVEHDGQEVKAVWANGTAFTGDYYVCCLGTYSRDLFLNLGIDLPIYPVKGYSLTIPITDKDAAPVSTVMDETYKIAITRFDDRIRVGGMAELSGYYVKLNEKRRETLELSVTDLFPDGGDVSRASFWSGLRPVTPDSTPIIGGSTYNNLAFNCGHGTLGWTMSLGSAKVMSDLLSGKRPEIDAHDLSMQRYAKGGKVLAKPIQL